MYLDPSLVGVIHFIGIGGIGMSGIADILHSLGYAVQGSDLVENGNVRRLRERGIPLMIGHDPSSVERAAVVVISSDVPKENVELCRARALGLPVVRRAEMLAELMRLKPSIAVSGTHGKTSTTSLGATVLEGAGLDPTVVSGGIINAYGTNARLGKGKWVIVEGDESDGTFTKLPATIAIVTNIDADHMETYGSFEKLRQAFVTFVENIPFYGLGVLCVDHPEVRSLLPALTDRRIVTYGLSDDADVQAQDILLDGEGATFTVVLSSHFRRVCSAVPEDLHQIKNVRLSMLGLHNVQNALSIIATALEIGVDPQTICAGLKAFKGVGRRFTKTGEVHGITVIDDYAHHPQEIRAVLKTARLLAPQKKVCAVWQPHRYSRLADLYSDFLTCFEGADHIIITPIYGAGEEKRSGFTHDRLVQDMMRYVPEGVSCCSVETLEDLGATLKGIVHSGDLVICMGAGSITTWAHALPQELGCLFQGEAEPQRPQISYNVSDEKETSVLTKMAC